MSNEKDKLWGVDIRVDGKNVLTIENDCLCGDEDIEKYVDIIRYIANRLLCFIGKRR